MRSEPSWVTAEELIELNALAVAATGEPHLLRDRGLLESAAGAPVNRWAYGAEEDMVALAATLMTAVARNHPFAQGNKRTAFLAFGVMLEANGYVFNGTDDVGLADAFVGLIAHEVDEGAFAERLRPHVVPRG